MTLTGATLNVTLVNGYIPPTGTSFTIVDAGSLSGTFLTVNLPTLPSSLSWVTNYDAAAGTVILSVSGVLPVELLDFNAKSSTEGVILSWQSATEVNTQHFIVERSRNGTDFYPMSQIKAKGSNSSYQDLDAKPFNGINYYRLHIVDLDGKATFSKIIAVLVGSKTFKIKVFPTYITNHTDLSVITDGGSIEKVEIVNLAGQILLTHQGSVATPQSQTQLSIQQLPNGVYWVRTHNTEGINSSIKIVKL
jgi:hypothetical protein